MSEHPLIHRSQLGGDPTLRKVPVVFDNWKAPIFKNHLDAAGFKYKGPKQLTRLLMLLEVEHTSVHDLHPVVFAAQKECEQRKANKTQCVCGCYSGGCGRPDGCQCNKDCPCGAARNST